MCRINAWGFGIWKDRFDRLRAIGRDEYERLVKNGDRLKKLEEACGKDVIRMLKQDAYGMTDAGDVKLMYAQFLSDQYTVYPVQSLVQNIGHDGSGTHCLKSDRFKVAVSDRTIFNFTNRIVVDPRIVQAHSTYREENEYILTGAPQPAGEARSTAQINTVHQKNLENNLKALMARSPILAQRLRWPVEMPHLGFDESNRPAYRFHGTWQNFQPSRSEIAKEISSDATSVFLFGIGFGEYIQYALETNAKIRITAWERDPAILRIVLMQHDVSTAIEEGRLQFLLGVDLIRYTERLEHDDIIFHPYFSRIYALERAVLEKRNIKNCIAIANGGQFIDNLSNQLKKFGYTPWPLDMQRWAEEELRYSFATLDPDFLVSINYINGAAEFCEALQLPYLCWEIDPDLAIKGKARSTTEYTYIYTCRKRHGDLYKKAGFGNVIHLPLASDRAELKHHTAIDHNCSKYRSDVAFQGMTKVQEASLLRKKFVDLYVRFKNGERNADKKCELMIQEILDKQLLDGSRFIVPNLFEQRFFGFEEFLRNAGTQLDPLKIIAQIAAAERQLHYVASLGVFNVQVWGDSGWRLLEQYGAEYRGDIEHPQELKYIHCGAMINVDIGRLYQLDVVPQRVFDILAHGGFLIAEHCDDLEELFDIGNELESYRTVDELHEKVAYYLEKPEKAKSIAVKGIEAIDSKHSVQHRITQMLKKADLQ